MSTPVEQVRDEQRERIKAYYDAPFHEHRGATQPGAELRQASALEYAAAQLFHIRRALERLAEASERVSPK